MTLFEQVYDVTKFLEDHPGGDEVLLSSTGLITIAMSLIYEYFFSVLYLQKPAYAPRFDLRS